MSENPRTASRARSEIQKKIKEVVSTGFWQPRAITLEALLLLALIALRALAVADYDPTGALEIVARAGLSSVALGSLIPLLPALLPYLVLLTVLRAALSASTYTLAIAGVLLVLTLLMTPTTAHSVRALRHVGNNTILGRLLLGILWLGVTAIILFVIADWQDLGRPSFAATGGAVTALACLCAGWWIATTALGYGLHNPRELYRHPPVDDLSQMWLPPERVLLDGGRAVVIGYALEDTPRESVFLLEDSRHTIHVKPTEILSRETCVLRASPNRRPVLSTHRVAAPLPLCR